MGMLEDGTPGEREAEVHMEWDIVNRFLFFLFFFFALLQSASRPPPARLSPFICCYSSPVNRKAKKRDRGCKNQLLSSHYTLIERRSKGDNLWLLSAS